MYHACTEHFQPAGVFADRATLATAKHTIYIHFHARFGEREVAFAKACPSSLTIHLIGEVNQYPFEIAEGDMFANCKSFYLIKHRFVRGINCFIAVAFARKNDANGFRCVFAHSVNLPRAGVSSQEQAGCGGIERIPHIPGRVAWRHIEQLEVVLVGLYVRAVVDLEAHGGENGVDVAQGAGGDMQLAQILRPTREGYVDTFGTTSRL